MSPPDHPAPDQSADHSQETAARTERLVDRSWRSARHAEAVAVEFGPGPELAGALAQMNQDWAGEHRYTGATSPEIFSQAAGRYRRAAESGVIPPEMRESMAVYCQDLYETIDELAAGTKPLPAADRTPRQADMNEHLLR